MRKFTVIKVLALLLVGYMIVSGYAAGPAASNGYDCTGAETGLGNPTGCSAGNGCHSSSATAGIGVTLELDSNGYPLTHYVGGVTYQVKISGINNTSNSLPRFGFQIGSIAGATPQATPTNAGTWVSPYPTNTHYSAPRATLFVVGVVEHSSPLVPTTGTGGNGSTYIETFNWQAPISGTGPVSIWGALNAVNNDGHASASDLWNVTHIVLNEILTGVESITNNNNVKVYPNPVTSQAIFSLGIEIENATLVLYDVTGREVKSLNFSGNEVTLKRDNLSSGIYFYNITNRDNSISTGRLIIQ